MINKKKVINKIAIIINWPREINYYKFFIDQLKKEKIILIVNDIPSQEKERINNKENIIKILNEKKIEFILFSEVFNNYKFKVLISTGLTCPKKISFKSVLKYFYALTFGYFLEFTKLNKIFQKIIDVNLSAGGLKATIYDEWFPEKKIGEKTIFFPRGLDLRLKYFPNKKFEKVFDIFLCYGLFDSNLIKQKFKKSRNYIVGIPRYDKELSSIEAKKNIYSEFKLDDKKKLIFWCPTYIEEVNEKSKNIELWLNKISELNKNYNIILRPHPKNLIVDENISKKILSSNIHVDKKLQRNLLEIYTASDLVIVDFGASALTSIYLKKKIIFLELPNEYTYIKRLINTKAMDMEVRKSINKSLIMKLDNPLFTNEVIKIIENSDNKISVDLKKKFFGKSDSSLPLNSIINIIESEIKNV